MAYDPERDWKVAMRNKPRTPYAKWCLGFGLAMAVYVVFDAVFDRTANSKDIVKLWPVLVPMIIGFSLSPFARDQILWNPHDAEYDEFEKHTLLVASAKAYYIVLVLIVLLCFWCWLGGLYGWTIPSRPYDWTAIGAAYLYTGIMLPSLLAEIYIPIPPKGEGEDDA